jgi:hypothetical protein
MTWGAGFAAPARMTIGNLVSGETMEVIFNPTELMKKLNVNWTRLEPPGLPHQILQYKGTSNLSVPMTLIAHAYTDRARPRDAIEEFEKFIMSLCYPSENAQSVSSGAPPRCLVVWPGVLVFTAVLAGEVSFQHVQFAPEGGTLRYSASVTFEEIRDTRLTSEDVRFAGTLRITTSSSSE